VIRGDGWQVVNSPPLVRVEIDGHAPMALLSVWNHPRLGEWLGSLIQPPPARTWQPTSGLRLPVLFTEGTAGILLHELIGHLVEADLVVSKSSPLATHHGSNITASSVQIVDDPQRIDLPGGFSCDDEGVPAQPHQLVRDGRLVGWLCDRSGGDALGQAPGRGRRAGWARPPVARLSNLVIGAGEFEPGALQRELSHGLVVTRIGGATVDPLSTRLVLRVERGWEIRHGRQRRALAPFELTGGVLDVISHVEPQIGSDPTPDWRLGWCIKDGLPLPTGSEAPSMVIRQLEVL
jgi:TldD protein